MMKNEITDILEDFRDVIGKHTKFLYFTRGIECQNSSIKELQEFMKKITKCKEGMIEQKDEESANIMLSLEYFLDAFLNELNMLVSLKEDRMDEAWNSLILAQSSLRSSFQANDIPLKLGGEAHLQRLYLFEKLLFPPQTFFSIGGIVKKAICSICDQEYGKCGHLLGKPYMGKLCHRKIIEMDLKETSIVDNPANKLCRMTSFGENGAFRDALTWRIMNKT